MSDGGKGNFASKRAQWGTRFTLPSVSKLARGNVTSENHHGGFPYQFLSRHVERQNQRQKIVDGHAHYTLKANHRLTGGWYAKKPRTYSIGAIRINDA